MNRIGRRRHHCLQGLTQYGPIVRAAPQQWSRITSFSLCRCQLFLFARWIKAPPSQWGSSLSKARKACGRTVGRTRGLREPFERADGKWGPSTRPDNTWDNAAFSSLGERHISRARIRSGFRSDDATEQSRGESSPRISWSYIGIRSSCGATKVRLAIYFPYLSLYRVQVYFKMGEWNFLR